MPELWGDLLLQLDDLPPRVISTEPIDGARDITPADPVPGSPEHRILMLAALHGRPEVAEKLRHYIGDSSCPSCGSRFDIAHGLA